MLSAAPNSIARSSLEQMLEALQRRDEGEKPRDIPPALPRRAVSRSRLPSAKRRLPVSSEADGIRKSLELNRGKIRGHGGYGFRDEKDREMDSGEWFYVAASDEKRMEESTLDEIGAMEDSREQVLQGTREVLNGLQANHDRVHLHELNEVAVTVQSYVRGEIARKEFSVMLEMKNQENQKKLEQVMAIVQLQSVIRGWLSQRHFNQLQKFIQSAFGKLKSDISISELKNLSPAMLSLYVEVLQKRVSTAEATVELKEKDIASLREQVEQNEARLRESEAKIKSAQETWQKQITVLQMDLAAAKKSLAEENAVCRSAEHDGRKSPPSHKKMDECLNHGSRGAKEFEKIRKVSLEHEKEVAMVVDVKSGSHVVIPMEKLKRLKRMIKGWVKEKKARLRNSKTKIHSIGEADSHWRTWWGKKCKRS